MSGAVACFGGSRWGWGGSLSGSLSAASPTTPNSGDSPVGPVDVRCDAAALSPKPTSTDVSAKVNMYAVATTVSRRPPPTTSFPILRFFEVSGAFTTLDLCVCSHRFDNP